MLKPMLIYRPLFECGWYLNSSVLFGVPGVRTQVVIRLIAFMHFKVRDLKTKY